MEIGIVAYTAEERNSKVVVNRACQGVADTIETDNWEELVDFLSQDFGKALHICWSLYYFSEAIFSRLSSGDKKAIEDNPRTFIGSTKIFSTERLLGITVTRHIKDNFYSKAENNFYGLSRWLPSDTEVPETAQAVEKIGYDLMAGLEKLGIYPDKLTSPIGLFAEQLDFEKLPTIYNFPETHIKAMNYAEAIMGYEWREEFKEGEGYHYDQTSSYPFFIANLPDTRHGTISRKQKPCQWGIVKGKLTLGTKNHRVLPIDINAEYFTTEEIDWVEKHNLGIFEVEDGYYFNFNGGKPYKPIVDRLIQARQTDDAMASNLARKIAQGLSGYLDQRNKDGSMGKLYNPILAALVRSRCRLAVGDFIFDNALQDSILAVTVDGVVATKKLDLPAISKPGEWRLVEKISEKA